MPLMKSQQVCKNNNKILDFKLRRSESLADLRGGARDARPFGSNFFHCHAVFGENLVK